MHSPWESALEPFPMSLTEPLIPLDNELPFFLSEEVDSLCESPSQITENEISQQDLVFLSPNKNHSVPRTTLPALAPERQPQQSYIEERPGWKETSLITVYGQLSQLLFALHLAHDTFCRGETLGISDRSSIEQIFSTVSITLRCRELALAIDIPCTRLDLISLSSSNHLIDQHCGGHIPASFGRSPAVNGAHAAPLSFGLCATIAPDLHHALIIAAAAAAL